MIFTYYFFFFQKTIKYFTFIMLKHAQIKLRKKIENYHRNILTNLVFIWKK